MFKIQITKHCPDSGFGHLDFGFVSDFDIRI